MDGDCRLALTESMSGFQDSRRKDHRDPSQLTVPRSLVESVPTMLCSDIRFGCVCTEALTLAHAGVIKDFVCRVAILGGLVAVSFRGVSANDGPPCQLIRVRSDRQILVLYGPGSVDAALSVELDPAVRTFVDFRVVPDGMRYLRHVPATALITNINLCGVRITDDDLAFVCDRFPALKGLEIVHASELPQDEMTDVSAEDKQALATQTFSPATLRHVVRLEQLQQLELSGIPVQTEDLAFLSEVPNLRDLTISNCNIDDSALQRIGRAPLLEQLLLYRTRITGTGLRDLATCHELKALGLDGTRVSDTLATDMADLAQLRLQVLSVRGCGLTPEGIAALEQTFPFTSLLKDNVREIAPVPTWMTDPQLIRKYRRAFAAMSRLYDDSMAISFGRGEGDGDCLDRLSLAGHPRLDDERVAELAHLVTLKELYLSNTAVTSDCAKDVAKLTRLELLECSETKFDDSAIAALASLKSLRCLGLQQTRLTDAGAEELAKHRQLEKLLIGGTLVTDVGVGHLAELPNLTTLDLAECPVTDASERHFVAMKSLRALRLCGTGVTAEMIARLHKARPELEIDVRLDGEAPDERVNVVAVGACGQGADAASQ